MRKFIDIACQLTEGIKDTPQFIENPNSSGQGFHPEHSDHPFHDVLTKHQYRYSHSTPIHTRKTIYSDLPPVHSNEYNVHHTYKNLDMRDHNVGIYNGGWEAGQGGQRRRTQGNTPEGLDKFLRSHIKRATKKSASDLGGAE